MNGGQPDFSFVNEVDVEESPFVFVELPSMKVSELDDPLNDGRSAGAVNQALEFIFENFEINRYVYDVEDESLVDKDRVIESAVLLSVIMDSGGHVKVTAFLNYGLADHKIEQIPIEVDPSFQYTMDDVVISEDDTDSSVQNEWRQRIKAVLYLYKSEGEYVVEDYEYEPFEENSPYQPEN